MPNDELSCALELSWGFVMNISDKIRHKRFQVKEAANLFYLFESKGAKKYKLPIHNISILGFSVTSNVTLEDLEVGDIITVSKIITPSEDIPLGRTLVRHFTENTIGFSLIDSRLQVDSIFSKYTQSMDASGWETELSPEKFNIRDFKYSLGNQRDILTKTKKFSILLKDWRKKIQPTNYTVRENSMGARVKLRGIKKKALVLGSDDYLNLSHHPQVMEAVKTATSVYGFGSTGSPLTTGMTAVHDELCDFIAKFCNKEKVVLYNSGYAANLGAIQALAQANDLMMADFLSHASIQDGLKLSEAHYKLFKHNASEHLEQILKQKRHEHHGCLVITEGVFSLDGDLADLPAIIAVAKKHDARVYLDESHALGVLGPSGRGLAEHYDCSNDIDVLMGSFSKCFGGVGGFIASDASTCDWLYWLARSHMFSASIPAGAAAGVLQAAKILTEDPSLVASLHQNITQFTQGLRSLGAKIPVDGLSSIIPVVIGDEEKMGIMNKYLTENGIFVVSNIYPQVSANRCRFRFTINAAFTESDIDYVLLCFKNAMERAGFSFPDQA